MGREDGAEQQHVELALVVGDEDGGAGGEVGPAGDDVEAHAGEEQHRVFEGARDGVLGAEVVGGQAEEEGGEDAVGGAEEEAEVGGEEAGEEGGGAGAEEVGG